MSVPKWRRTTPKEGYVHTAYELNKKVAYVVASKPRKYKDTYGDHLIKTALKCLQYCQLANGIFLDLDSTVEMFELKNNYLRKAKSYAINIGTVAEIFLDLTMKQDGQKKTTTLKQMESIGGACQELASRINGLNKYNHELLRTKENRVKDIERQFKDLKISEIINKLS